MGPHGDGVVSAAASQHEDHSSCQTLQLLGSNWEGEVLGSEALQALHGGIQT